MLDAYKNINTIKYKNINFNWHFKKKRKPLKLYRLQTYKNFTADITYRAFIFEYANIDDYTKVTRITNNVEKPLFVTRNWKEQHDRINNFSGHFRKSGVITSDNQLACFKPICQTYTCIQNEYTATYIHPFVAKYTHTHTHTHTCNAQYILTANQIYPKLSSIFSPRTWGEKRVASKKRDIKHATGALCSNKKLICYWLQNRRLPQSNKIPRRSSTLEYS